MTDRPEKHSNKSNTVSQDNHTGWEGFFWNLSSEEYSKVKFKKWPVLRAKPWLSDSDMKGLGEEDRHHEQPALMLAASEMCSTDAAAV